MTTAPHAAPKNIAATDAALLANLGLLPFASAEFPGIKNSVVGLKPKVTIRLPVPPLKLVRTIPDAVSIPKEVTDGSLLVALTYTSGTRTAIGRMVPVGSGSSASVCGQCSAYLASHCQKLIRAGDGAIAHGIRRLGVSFSGKMVDRPSIVRVVWSKSGSEFI
jgi:hypothetical protein